MREPMIARWPGKLPAGRICMEVGSTLDFFPTCLKLAGAEPPADRPIDGIDLMPTLEGKASRTRTIYFYRGEHLNAVRHGKWKLHFRYYDHSGKPGYQRSENWVSPEKPLLFNLDEDPSG